MYKQLAEDIYKDGKILNDYKRFSPLTYLTLRRFILNLQNMPAYLEAKRTQDKLTEALDRALHVKHFKKHLTMDQYKLIDFLATDDSGINDDN